MLWLSLSPAVTISETKFSFSANSPQLTCQYSALPLSFEAILPYNDMFCQPYAIWIFYMNSSGLSRAPVQWLWILCPPWHFRPPFPLYPIKSFPSLPSFDCRFFILLIFAFDRYDDNFMMIKIWVPGHRSPANGIASYPSKGGSRGPEKFDLLIDWREPSMKKLKGLPLRFPRFAFPASRFHPASKSSYGYSWWYPNTNT